MIESLETVKRWTETTAAILLVWYSVKAVGLLLCSDVWIAAMLADQVTCGALQRCDHATT